MLWIILLQLTMLIAGFFQTTIRPCRAWTTGGCHVMARQQQQRSRLCLLRPLVLPGMTTTARRRYYSASTIVQSSSSISTSAAAIDSNYNQTNTASTETLAEIMERRRLAKERRKASKTKRKALLGIAKAVDRGKPNQVTYAPGGPDGQSFQAKSGLPNRTGLFTVLGIESSCDDTGAAVVRSDGVILGQALASQHDIHEAFGGVVPGLARDAHVQKIHGIVQEALTNAGLNSVRDDVDAIAVTVGPGLEICLRVGCDKARELAMQYNKPFVAIHHLEAHILMARLPSLIVDDDDDDSFHVMPATADTHESHRTVDFPFLALLVSGGHCQIMKCLGIGRYEILGGTMDDSLGECFDKTARLLGLPVGGGGGPAVEKLARQAMTNTNNSNDEQQQIHDHPIKLPVPLQYRKDLDFSYAGLKTAVRQASEKLAVKRGVASVDQLPDADKANIAASFQNVAIQHIEQRLKYAMQACEEEEQDGIRTLVVVGGVAANTELRKRLDALCANRGGPRGGSRQRPWKMLVPPPALCTDQGAMSAWAGVERLMVASSDDPTDQQVYARFPFAAVAAASAAVADSSS